LSAGYATLFAVLAEPPKFRCQFWCQLRIGFRAELCESKRLGISGEVAKCPLLLGIQD